MKQDRIISLFSGAGGMSFGFAQCGLKPFLAADIDPDACRTYWMNIGLEPFETDISAPSDTLLKLLKATNRPFAIIGGPPCQGFSSAGRKDGLDKRNKLIFNFLHYRPIPGLARARRVIVG